MLATLALASFVTFTETTSPSGDFAVAWRVPGKEYSQGDLDKDDAMASFPEDQVEDLLVNLKTQSVIALIKGMQGFPHENHSVMVASYNPTESVVVVQHDGKWQPREVIALSTATGKQVDLFKASLGPLSRYAMAHRGKFTKKEVGELIYPVDTMSWVNGRLHMHIDAAVAKDMRNWSVPMEEVVAFSGANSKLRIASISILEAKP